MKSKLRWIPLVLIVGSLLAGCHPRIEIVIMTPTPLSVARVTPARGQILPSSVTPGPKPMRSATATPAPTGVPPTAKPATAIPAPTLAPASNPMPTAMPIPTSSATPTSLLTGVKGVVVTTPTPILSAAASQVELTPQSAEGLYFVRGDILYQMNLDGSDLRTVTQGLQNNTELVIDPIHRKIYAGRWDQSPQILVFDLDARDLKVFSDGPGDGGQGLAIDPVGNKMFHGLYYGGVNVMDMNAVGAWTQLVDPALLDPMYGQRGQLQIDPVNRHIYFRSTFNGDCGQCRYIWRVGFDGEDLVKIILANGGDALALDLTEQKMYFSDVPDEPASNTVKRANLDGSAVETLLTIPAPYHLCYSMALDVEHKKIYLNLSADGNDGYRGKAIARANMDGSGFEILHTLTGNTTSEVSGYLALFLPQ